MNPDQDNIPKKIKTDDGVVAYGVNCGTRCRYRTGNHIVKCTKFGVNLHANIMLRIIERCEQCRVTYNSKGE